MLAHRRSRQIPFKNPAESVLSSLTSERKVPLSDSLSSTCAFLGPEVDLVRRSLHQIGAAGCSIGHRYCAYIPFKHNETITHTRQCIIPAFQSRLRNPDTENKVRSATRNMPIHGTALLQDALTCPKTGNSTLAEVFALVFRCFSQTPHFVSYPRVHWCSKWGVLFMPKSWSSAPQGIATP